VGFLRRIIDSFRAGGQKPYWSAMLWPDAASPAFTPRNAWRLSPVYRGVTLIANDLARLRLRIKGGESEEVLYALTRQANRYQSAGEFRRSMVLSALLRGNGLARIVRTVGGDLAELVPLDAGGARVELTDGKLVYHTAEFGELEPDDVLHLRAPSLSGLWGESPFGLCSSALALAMDLEQTGIKLFRHGGIGKLALVNPNKLSDGAAQKIQDDYARLHGGVENAAKPLVLGEGMRVEKLPSTLEDAAWIEARNFAVQDVARITGVPLPYLSEHSRTSYGNMEWLGRVYVEACLSHWGEAFASEVEAKLLPPGAQLVTDYDRIARGSLAETMAALRTGVEAGVITRNEARDKLDYDPLPGLDDPILAMNMTAGGPGGSGQGGPAKGQDTNLLPGAAT
jgi:HK97 family phage portal protein